MNEQFDQLPHRYFIPGEIVLAFELDQRDDDQLFKAVKESQVLRGEKGFSRLLFDMQQQTSDPDQEVQLFRSLQVSSEDNQEVIHIAEEAMRSLTTEKGLDRALEQFAQEDIQTSAGTEGKVISTVFLLSPPDSSLARDAVLVYLAGELNKGARELEAEFQEMGVQATVLGVSPSWRFSSSQGNVVTGGPGTQPVPASSPVTAADYRIEPRPKKVSRSSFWKRLMWVWRYIVTGNPFPLPEELAAEIEIQELVNSFEEGAKGEIPVSVYILDTVPPISQLQQATESWTGISPKGAQNELLGLLADGLIKQDEFHHKKDKFNLWLYDDARDEDFKASNHASAAIIEEHFYQMPDHGLFVAGIIRTLAPNAELHLIEVLNCYGIGTSRSLTWGLNQIAKISSQGNQSVINCSLTIGYNFSACKNPQDKWEKLFCFLQNRLGINFLKGLEIQLARLNQYTIIAAAGNDSIPGKPQSETRYPAAFEKVIGVGALTHDYQQAPYANLPDKPLSDGFATIGGDVDGSTPAKADSQYGILSSFISPEFPDGANTPNTTGSARWAGTSFATAIVSGLFARLYGLNMSEEEAIELIKNSYKEEPINGFHVLPMGQGRP